MNRRLLTHLSYLQLDNLKRIEKQPRCRSKRAESLRQRSASDRLGDLVSYGSSLDFSRVFSRHRASRRLSRNLLPHPLEVRTISSHKRTTLMNTLRSKSTHGPNFFFNIFKLAVQASVWRPSPVKSPWKVRP